MNGDKKHEYEIELHCYSGIRRVGSVLADSEERALAVAARRWPSEVTPLSRVTATRLNLPDTWQRRDISVSMNDALFLLARRMTGQRL